MVFSKVRSPTLCAMAAAIRTRSKGFRGKSTAEHTMVANPAPELKPVAIPGRESEAPDDPIQEWHQTDPRRIVAAQTNFLTLLPLPAHAGKARPWLRARWPRSR